MKKLLLITLLLLAPFCLQAREFQGITTTTTDGDADGLHEMNEMCDTAFSGSIMCTWDDMNSDPGTLNVDWLTNAAWVRPGKEFEYPFSLQQGYSFMDCKSWTISISSYTALSYGATGGSAGGFHLKSCNSLLKVACCK